VGGQRWNIQKRGNPGMTMDELKGIGMLKPSKSNSWKEGRAKSDGGKFGENNKDT
jgi:hypothetical protein